MTGVPTIKFFKHSKPQECVFGFLSKLFLQNVFLERYNGPRETDGVLSWLDKKTGPAVVTLAESDLAIESRLLGLVIRELRQNKDPKQALARLDEYASRFPSGLLQDEAQAARVDALLLSGRRAEALAILERTSFARLPRGGELRVLRGELRAASGR